MQSFMRIYRGVIRFGNRFQSVFLLIVRLYWGWSFFSGGMAKLSNIDQIAHYFQTLHIPFSTLNAHLAAWTECLGGALLLLGLASRVAAIPLIFTMLVAYLTAETSALKMLFSNPDMFTSRSPFLFLFASVIVFTFGPGFFSVDELLERKVFKY